MPTSKDIRQAYIKAVKKQNRLDDASAEEKAQFLEKQLTPFIQKYIDPDFKGVFEPCYNKDYYDEVLSKVTRGEADRVNEKEDNIYFQSLREYIEFFDSKVYEKLWEKLWKKLWKKQPCQLHATSNKAMPKSQPTTVAPVEEQVVEQVEELVVEEVVIPVVKQVQIDVTTLTEGQRQHVVQESEVAQRNPHLRQACIARYGYQCQCCGIDFATAYGALGEAFIEVHHLVPIACYDTAPPKDYVANLVPLCPNCHAMIHRLPEALHGPEALQALRQAYQGPKTPLRLCYNPSPKPSKQN